jgi:transposase
MSMVCGLDLHRGQITFDALEVDSGEVWRGRLWQPDRQRFRRWLAEELAPRAHGGPVAVAVEGCTGWRYVVEEVTAAGFEAHLAEPADTQAARGRKKHAKTDRSDSRLLRELLQSGDLPESWIPPEAVLEWRERVRLYKSLMDQRRIWIQRIHAELYHHGVALPDGEIASEKTRQWLAGDTVQLSVAARQRIAVGYRMIDATTVEVLALRRVLQHFARRQPACRALTEAHYGIGELTAVAVWAELGDCRRFFRSEQVVRHTAWTSRWMPPTATGPADTCPARVLRRCAGRCSRQARARREPPAPTAPYQAVKQRHDGKLATIAMARKLARRCYHTLQAMDPDLVYAMPKD